MRTICIFFVNQVLFNANNCTVELPYQNTNMSEEINLCFFCLTHFYVYNFWTISQAFRYKLVDSSLSCQCSSQTKTHKKFFWFFRIIMPVILKFILFIQIKLILYIIKKPHIKSSSSFVWSFWSILGAILDGDLLDCIFHFVYIYCPKILPILLLCVYFILNVLLFSLEANFHS